jgi:hypothetical protein
MVNPMLLNSCGLLLSIKDSQLDTPVLLGNGQWPGQALLLLKVN